MIDNNFSIELVKNVEEMIKNTVETQVPDERSVMLINLKDFFAVNNVCQDPNTDFVFLFAKIWPMTFQYNLPEVRRWLELVCFENLDPISVEVLKQLFGLH